MTATKVFVIYQMATSKVVSIVVPERDEQFFDMRCVADGQAVVRVGMANYVDNFSTTLALLGLT